VSANEPYEWIFAHFGWRPNKSLATLPLRAAPAVCEEEGPIMTGPMISKTDLNFIAQTPSLQYLTLILHDIATINKNKRRMPEHAPFPGYRKPFHFLSHFAPSGRFPRARLQPQETRLR